MDGAKLALHRNLSAYLAKPVLYSWDVLSKNRVGNFFFFFFSLFLRRGDTGLLGNVALASTTTTLELRDHVDAR